ncbi:hypothetical protein VD0002_g2119 [Verticillium dahliae]|uniref:Ribonuclease T2-like n=1 Tax=Verticillium dahliae TaxID=27337 RepID=A0AA44WR70_VERDA|nr:DNA replication licensing factor mcm3 [Verticillium dahliae VDG2]KAH6702422.1 ribonuclease Trv [Verticillium dahliae]PNH36176.1 hypothetical protein BJF96_g252 [Verticillium dahliae]PNH53967.1 hypothetical protein VD0003_g3488 [Verticillium dahliae]PNH67666.1 hypothetical protein VD0002_g2119 [Verticillium dahliae]
MHSGKSIFSASLAVSGALAANSLLCPSDVPQSCHNTTAFANACCFSAPGGQILQTQFWDSNPATGPDDSWTIHGLWPENCDGTYEQFCAPEREYTNITAILAAASPCSLKYMDTFWKDQNGNDESFWEHEFNKHGTCMNTLEPTCYPGYTPGQEVVDYVKKTIQVFKTLPSYEWLKKAGIVPSETVTYTLDQIQTVLTAHHGHNVIVNCNKNKELNELWYHFNVKGSIQTGVFVPVDPVGSPSSCPKEGIKYLPKKKAGATTPAATTTAASTLSTVLTSAADSTSTANPPSISGKGHLFAASSGVSSPGFLVSGGTWYRGGGTPATFTATPAAGGSFTLTSSKGNCAVQENGSLLCASSVVAGSSFGYDGAFLTYAGSSAFYAAEVPAGNTQSTVFTKANAVTVQFTWTAA